MGRHVFDIGLEQTGDCHLIAAKAKAPISVERLGRDRAEKGDKLLARVGHVGQEFVPVPVSYTHLDVYKRQAPRGARLVLMTATGRQHSSAELAAWLQTQLEQVGTLAFLIGGPVGFDPATIAAAHEQLALSRLTLPHELARVVLLEQLYRAFTIIHGEPYHK